MNLWGVCVTEKSQSVVEVPEDRDLLITRIALGPGAPKGVPTIISLVNNDYDDETYVLGTLRGETCEQFEVDVNICADSIVTLKVSGPGNVHLVGYYNRLSSFESDDDMFGEHNYGSNSDSDSDSGESDEINARVQAYMGGGDSSSGDDDYDDRGHVEEVSNDSDSDIDVDEVDSKSPVKQKNSQHIQPKLDAKPTLPPKPQVPQQKPAEAVQRIAQQKTPQKNPQQNQPQQQKPQQQNNAQQKPQPQQPHKPQQQQPNKPDGAPGEKKKKKKKKNKGLNAGNNPGGNNPGGQPQKKKRGWLRRYWWNFN